MEKHARACEDRCLVEGIEAFFDAIDQLVDPYFHSLSSAGAQHPATDEESFRLNRLVGRSRHCPILGSAADLGELPFDDVRQLKERCKVFVREGKQRVGT